MRKALILLAIFACATVIHMKSKSCYVGMNILLRLLCANAEDYS